MIDGKHFTNGYKPVNVFRNGLKLAGWQPSTKTSLGLVSFEGTYDDTASIKLYGNTTASGGVGDLEAGVYKFPVSSDIATVTVELANRLNKVGSVLDEYDITAGTGTKRISGAVILDGSRSWAYVSSSAAYKVFRIAVNSLTEAPKQVMPFPALVYKYDGNVVTAVTSGATIDTVRYASDTYTNFYYYVGNADTGMSQTVIPLPDEIKAYFYGWKMCNSDGTSPYVKSEVPYNPITWSEWSGGSPGLIKDATGIYFPTTASQNFSMPNTNFSPNTKYGLLFNVIIPNSSSFRMFNTLRNGTYFNTDVSTTGYKKFVFSTTTITSNTALMGFSSIATGDFKCSNIQIFELPAGSQIETDFNNMTAVQLAAKYTFNGLCIKNWKSITDGSGFLPSTIPAVYSTGFTPYRMVYQLATPIPITGTPQVISTHYPSSVITVETTVKPTIEATVKVMI